MKYAAASFSDEPVTGDYEECVFHLDKASAKCINVKVV